MTLRFAVTILALFGASGLAHAADGKALMEQSDCFSCHAVDQKIVGPSFKDVAKRYRGKSGATAQLADKIIKGGAGNWNAVTGGVSMPPHPQLSKEDAAAMVKWILSQK